MHALVEEPRARKRKLKKKPDFMAGIMVNGVSSDGTFMDRGEPWIEKDGWPRHPSLGMTIAQTYRTCFNTAPKRGLEFSLSWEEFNAIVKRAAGRCEVSGITFSLRRPHGLWRRPFIPSLDRISSSIGYTAENCRLVCSAVNVAMNEWGLEVFLEIARAAVARADGAR